MSKLKGCRPSDQIILEITNVSAHYGAALYRQNTTLPADLAHLKLRLDELHLEIAEARKQEAKLKEVPPVKEEPSLIEVVQ